MVEGPNARVQARRRASADVAWNPLLGHYLSPDSAMTAPATLDPNVRTRRTRTVKNGSHIPLKRVANKAKGTTVPPKNKTPITTAHPPQSSHVSTKLNSHVIRPNMKDEMNMAVPVKPRNLLKIESGKKITRSIATATQPTTISGCSRCLDAQAIPRKKMTGMARKAMKMVAPSARLPSDLSLSPMYFPLRPNAQAHRKNCHSEAEAGFSGAAPC